MQQPLGGIKIVEICEGACGPFCAMQLGDLGADVIKIECFEGDRLRHTAPTGCDESTALFSWLNRNKRSLALDLEAKDSLEVVKRLARTADVVLEDLGPGEAERLGIGYDVLRAENDALVYASISPFGERGPLANCAGSELVIQAMADYTGSLGSQDAPPVRLGTDVAQINTAIFAFQAIMAALFQRARTQTGQRVSVSMLGSLLHLRGVMWTSLGNPDDWFGFYNDTYVKPPEFGYQTKDRPINFSLGSGTSDDWDQLLTELEMFDVLADERFGHYGREAVGVGRYAHEVHARWEEAFQDMTADEAIAIIRKRKGNTVPFNDYDSLCRHPQVEALGLIAEVPLETGATIRAVAPPWVFSDTPTRSAHSAPPGLGRHSVEVLREIGYDDDAVGRLLATEVVKVCG